MQVEAYLGIIVSEHCLSYSFRNYNHQNLNTDKTMVNPQSIYEYKDESQADKLARKSKDSPFMIIGIMGLIGVCSFGAYKYKTKGKMSTSVYLMQLRVAAQGTVVAALTIGLAYSLVKNHLLKNDKKE